MNFSMSKIIEHVWHLRRHLLARDASLIGEELVLNPKEIRPVPGVLHLEGTSEISSLVDNGLGDDKEAHLVASEALKAREIGKTLYVPSEMTKIIRADSPLPRASETTYHMWVGMVSTWAEKNLEVRNGDNPTPEEKVRMSREGLNRLTDKPKIVGGLNETFYKNSSGEEDCGSELVVLAYNRDVNPYFSGYKLMTELGLRRDSRSEHPVDIAERGLRGILPYLFRHNVVLSGTHQPNDVSILAYLMNGPKDIGGNANEVWANAGGEVDLGGGLELRVYEKEGNIIDAGLRRTMPKEQSKQPGYDGAKLQDNYISLSNAGMDALMKLAV